MTTRRDFLKAAPAVPIAAAAPLATALGATESRNLGDGLLRIGEVIVDFKRSAIAVNADTPFWPFYYTLREQLDTLEYAVYPTPLSRVSDMTAFLGDGWTITHPELFQGVSLPGISLFKFVGLKTPEETAKIAFYINSQRVHPVVVPLPKQPRDILCVTLPEYLAPHDIASTVVMVTDDRASTWTTEVTKHGPTIVPFSV